MGIRQAFGKLSRNSIPYIGVKDLKKKIDTYIGKRERLGLRPLYRHDPCAIFSLEEGVEPGPEVN